MNDSLRQRLVPHLNRSCEFSADYERVPLGRFWRIKGDDPKNIFAGYWRWDDDFFHAVQFVPINPISVSAIEERVLSDHKLLVTRNSLTSRTRDLQSEAVLHSVSRLVSPNKNSAQSDGCAWGNTENVLAHRASA